jgi:hypothetical protein
LLAQSCTSAYDIVRQVTTLYVNIRYRRTLDNKPPNQVLKDNDDPMARHINDSIHNQQVYKTVPFDTGDKVRKLERKEN